MIHLVASLIMCSKHFTKNASILINQPLIMKLSPFLLLQLALLGSLALPASANDLYWKRTTTAAWTTENWGPVSGGPYTSAWVSGSNVIFEDNGATALTITGATTNVGSITANENVTVTAGGTLTLAGSINVADGKSLTFGTQALSGTGIEKNGLGNLDLNASNSFTDGFAIRGGNVFVRNANALGSGSVILGATSGSDFAGLRVTTMTFARSIILAEGTTGTLEIANLGAGAKSIFTGGVTGTNNFRIRTVIGGSGESRVTMSTGAINHVGTLTLANTGNGTSTGAQGLIDIQSAITDSVTSLTVSNETTGTRGVQRVFIGNTNNAWTGNTTINSGATLILSNSNVIPDGAGKGNVVVNGAFQMRGNEETINGLSGTGNVTRGTAGTSTLTVGGNDATASFGGTIVNGSGTVALTKTGAGTQTLTGTNSFSGATNITAGTLEVSGAGSINSSSGISVASGAHFKYNSSTALTTSLSLNAGATLSGSGTIATAMTLNSLDSVLSPGNSPGIQTFGVSQNWASFTYEWELNDWVNSVVGANIDQIQITGGLTLSGTSYALNILSLDALNVAGFVGAGGGNTFTETSKSWTILTTTTGISGFNASTWALNTTGFQDADTGTWSLSQSGNNLVLSYTVIPEPGAALLGGFGILALLRRRR
jgi:autotransporter-associated beta strand protein